MSEPESHAPKGKTADKPQEPEATKPPTPLGAEAAPEWKDRYTYLLADFDNFRRRAERERETTVRARVGRLILKIVDMHDGIGEAKASLPPEAKAVREGLDLLLKNLDMLLKEERVEPLASPGDPFKLDVHEAVGNTEPTEKCPEGTVAHVVQQGYRYGDMVLRPAKVLVAHHEETPETPLPDKDPAAEPTGPGK